MKSKLTFGEKLKDLRTAKQLKQVQTYLDAQKTEPANKAKAIVP